MLSTVPFGPLAMLFQVVFLVLFAIFAEYDSTASGAPKKSGHHGDDAESGPNPLTHYYPMFQDVHVMMFIGFGFLMTLLKRYGFSGVGLNMVITAFCIQWSMVIAGFLSFIHHHETLRFSINIVSLINADFASAAVLISFGALLGKTSPVQMIVLASLEIVFFRVNEYIGLDILQATDTGGSMYVHVFGAYFGIAAARVLYDKKQAHNDDHGTRYNADLFAMIGTVFLWMYWPSFNAALLSGDRQHRAVINTYLSLAACCLTTFAVCSIVSKDRKFDMEHVQNATLAGGVAVGTVADMMIQPSGAIAIGMLSGMLASGGIHFLLPRLEEIHFHDTCGVNNLHGMPGLMSGIIGIILAIVGSESMYSYSLYEIYPARAPGNATELLEMQSHAPDVVGGLDRTALQQAGMQALALGMSFIVACVSGTITGYIVRASCWGPPEELYVDHLYWVVPDDYVTCEIPENNKKHIEKQYGMQLSDIRKGGIGEGVDSYSCFAYMGGYNENSR